MVALLDVVSVLATIALVALLLGPAPDARRMLQTQSTGVAPLLPLVTLFTNSLMWTIYGYLDDAIFPVGVCNFTGMVLSAIYTIIFYRFTTKRRYATTVIVGFGVVCLVTTAYAIVGGYGLTNQSRDAVKQVFGYLGIVTVLVFFSSTFENIADVFRFRSAVFIPIVLIVAGVVNSLLWVLYALLDTDWFIFVPNAGAFVISCVQIVLYYTFHPSTHPYDPTATAAVVGETEASGLPAKDLEASHSTVSFAGIASPRFVALQSPRAPVPSTSLA